MTNNCLYFYCLDCKCNLSNLLPIGEDAPCHAYIFLLVECTNLSSSTLQDHHCLVRRTLCLSFDKNSTCFQQILLTSRFFFLVFLQQVFLEPTRQLPQQ